MCPQCEFETYPERSSAHVADVYLLVSLPYIFPHASLNAELSVCVCLLQWEPPASLSASLSLPLSLCLSLSASLSLSLSGSFSLGGELQQMQRRERRLQQQQHVILVVKRVACARGLPVGTARALD
jgi:hypothetical protein